MRLHVAMLAVMVVGCTLLAVWCITHDLVGPGVVAAVAAGFYAGSLWYGVKA